MRCCGAVRLLVNSQEMEQSENLCWENLKGSRSEWCVCSKCGNTLIIWVKSQMNRRVVRTNATVGPLLYASQNQVWTLFATVSSVMHGRGGRFWYGDQFDQNCLVLFISKKYVLQFLNSWLWEWPRWGIMLCLTDWTFCPLRDPNATSCSWKKLCAYAWLLVHS